MPTTSNFGWTTPADTDLVKDGAAAIRTLGNGIDTSLVDLKGGTTGQVLSKNSNTDLDFTWVAQDDSNAIQNAIVDAKGDLISATAADTPARLASSGVNGDVLTVDTSTATGLKWAAPAAAAVTFKGCSAYRTTAQTISTATYTAMLLDAEEYDTDGFHSTTTNTSRFTIPAGCAGYYQCDAIVSFTADSTGMRIVAIYKNGTGVAYSNQFKGTASTAIGPQISKVLYLAVGDYIEFFVYQDTGINRNTNSGSTDHLFQISYLGA